MSEAEPAAPAGANTEDRRSEVRRMFDRIAPRYDLLNRVLSFGRDTSWRRRALTHLPTGPALRVLDVATGTADVVLLLLGREGVAAVTGCDTAEHMLALGRAKLARHARADAARLVVGDALQLPFPDGSFDAVTIAFGLRNVADVDLALRELRRVIVPGGRAIVLEFGMPEPGLFAHVYDLYRGTLLPAVGAVVSGDKDAYGYLDRTIRTFPSGEALRRRFDDAGFARSWQEPIMGGAVAITVGER